MRPTASLESRAPSSTSVPKQKLIDPLLLHPILALIDLHSAETAHNTGDPIALCVCPEDARDNGGDHDGPIKGPGHHQQGHGMRFMAKRVRCKDTPLPAISPAPSLFG